MTKPNARFLVLALLGLSACNPGMVTRAPGDAATAAIGPLETPAVVDASTGTCFTRDTTPAVIETVTEQIMVQPAQVHSDGTVLSPAIFRTVTRQRILRERREVEFETPCAGVMTPEFRASVQRALLARGYYRGPIDGDLTGQTASAIERFQADQGDVATATLTLQSARSLGLVALPRDTL